MRTFDVTLRITKPVVFPRLCVVCEKAEPDGTVDLSILGANTGSTTVLAAEELLDVGSGSAYSNNTSNNINGIPACVACSSGLSRYHRVLKIATYTSWIPGLLLVILLPSGLLVKIVLFLACVIAPPILSMIFPPAFGATFLNGKADYEFRSKKVADEFSKLNAATTESDKG